jgi:hypothetical protein
VNKSMKLLTGFVGKFIAVSEKCCVVFQWARKSELSIKFSELLNLESKKSMQ